MKQSNSLVYFFTVDPYVLSLQVLFCLLLWPRCKRTRKTAGEKPCRRSKETSRDSIKDQGWCGVPNFQKRDGLWTQVPPALRASTAPSDSHTEPHIVAACRNGMPTGTVTAQWTHLMQVSEPFVLWQMTLGSGANLGNERDHECYCYPTENWLDRHRWTCRSVTSILMFCYVLFSFWTIWKARCLDACFFCRIDLLLFF